MTQHHDAGPDRPRRRVDRLLGAAAEPTAERPPRPRVVAPRAVRWAALVVAVEVAALAAGMAGLLYLTATGSVASVGNAVGLAVVVAVLGIALAACAVGLWRVALWARAPVVVLQIILGMIGYTAAFQAGQPAFGIPVLVLVALELYLLATPEARLAFFRHTDA